MGIPLLFLDISGGEFLIIMIVAFLVLGPKQLPQVARKLGRAMNEIKSVSNEITKEFKNESVNIASELKAARESAKVEVSDLNIDSLSKPVIDQQPRRKNIFEDKPTSHDTVNKQSNNIQTVDNVNGETENI